MKRKTQKKKTKEITYGRLLAQEFFSLGDLVFQESVSVIDQGTREILRGQIKKK